MKALRDEVRVREGEDGIRGHAEVGATYLPVGAEWPGLNANIKTVAALDGFELPFVDAGVNGTVG